MQTLYSENTICPDCCFVSHDAGRDPVPFEWSYLEDYLHRMFGDEVE